MPNPDQPQLLVEDGFWRPADVLFARLRDEVSWDRSMTARLTASFGVPYNYAQMVYPAAPMHPALVPVAQTLSERLGVRFNNCLLNYYETERSKMGFHSDDTRHLSPGTGVAIVSVGAPRRITFRRRDEPSIRWATVLRPGSLLYMENHVQSEWVHAIKRERRPVGPRISLTWRAFETSSMPAADIP